MSGELVPRGGNDDGYLDDEVLDDEMLEFDRRISDEDWALMALEMRQLWEEEEERERQNKAAWPKMIFEPKGLEKTGEEFLKKIKPAELGDLIQKVDADVMDGLFEATAYFCDLFELDGDVEIEKMPDYMRDRSDSITLQARWDPETMEPTSLKLLVNEAQLAQNGRHAVPLMGHEIWHVRQLYKQLEVLKETKGRDLDWSKKGPEDASYGEKVLWNNRHYIKASDDCEGYRKQFVEAEAYAIQDQLQAKVDLLLASSELSIPHEKVETE